MIRRLAILFGVMALGCLVSNSAIRAEEEDDYGKGKGKGAAKAGNVIQLDLNKLPPDLAKALKKYTAGGEGKGKPAAATAPTKGKAPMAKKPAAAPAAKGGKGASQLPPGLAGKPANHPGRTHYTEHVLKGKTGGPMGKGGKPAAALGKGGKGAGPAGKGKGGPPYGKGKGGDED
jgi:hypothetical protein